MSSTQLGEAVVVGTRSAAMHFKDSSGTAANIDWVREQIETLDLDPIKVKLMDHEEGEGWSRGQADEADLMYRRFLYLSAKYPSQRVVPNKVVDIFWHAHILDTRKYAEDCERIFGYFLHHFPYFGMRGEPDARQLERAFAETNRLQVAEFGQQARMVMACCSSPGSCNAKGCTSKCSSEPPDPFEPSNCDAWPDPDDVSAAYIVRPTLRERTTRVCLREQVAPY